MKLIILFLPLCVSISLPAQNFLLELKVKNGQVRSVQFGCHSSATDGLDKNLDIPAPPFGMGSGIIGFLPAGDSDVPLLYREYRPLLFPCTWILSCSPSPKRPLQISWDSKSFPSRLKFTCLTQNGETDMRTTASLTIRQTESVRIQAIPLSSK